MFRQPYLKAPAANKYPNPSINPQIHHFFIPENSRPFWLSKFHFLVILGMVDPIALPTLSGHITIHHHSLS